MRFYPKQHQAYCGLDLHARTLYICIVSHDGESLVPHHYTANPATFLKVIAPYRDDIVVAVECSFTWYGLADLWTREGIAFVLGPALSMQAIHGGKAKNDRIDAQKIAVLLRGGMLPQAYVSPAAMRATRDLLRRRIPLRRKRAELLTHIPQTNSQYHVPESGKKSASKATRAGVAERFTAPAVPKSIEVDLALSDYDDQLLRDLEVAIVKTAKPHEATTLSLLQTVPGIGKRLSLGLLYAMHDSARFPRGQDCVSSCRLVTCAKESAGKRSGTSGTTLGNAYLQWAFSEAAVLCLRNHPAGQKYLARLEKKHGKGQALTVLAHKLARAVYDMFQRGTACDRDKVLHG
jgi:transposase